MLAALALSLVYHIRNGFTVETGGQYGFIVFNPREMGLVQLIP